MGGQFEDYWDSYYERKLAPSMASGFAEFSLPYMRTGGRLIDLGCGNGRDSLYFARNGINVTAVDLSLVGIETVRLDSADLPVVAIQDDFVKSKTLYDSEYDYCYSRWTIHTIDDSQEAELLDNVWGSLKADGGLFFIEARTTGDEIFGMGEKVGPREYIYKDHYRRFIQAEILADRMRDLGFEVVFFEEDLGFSRTEDSDPMLLRIVAKK